VFFVERESADGVNARNVFILAQQDHRRSRSPRPSGRLENEGDDRFLVLERGQRNDIDTKQRRAQPVQLRELPRAGQ
jgi:lipopolysaccharide export system permease protein